MSGNIDLRMSPYCQTRGIKAVSQITNALHVMGEGV